MSAIKRIISSIAAPVVNIIVPRTCLVCGCSLVEGEEVICLGCQLALPRTNLHLSAFNTIHKRIGGNHYISSACGWIYYYTDSPYARLIRAAKYEDMPRLAYYLGKMYAIDLKNTGVLDDVDVLLPVPMYWLKRLQRGYNQTDEIARGISEVTGIPVGDNLHAQRGHTAQARQSGAERYANVQNTYVARHGEELDGLSVTIVDDVVTTGATLSDCINAICRVSTPRKINILTIGVTHLR